MNHSQSEIRDLVKDVLAKGYIMSLATMDDGGLWVSDVVYIADDNFTIYWLSSVSTRHSKAILANPRVAGNISLKNGPGEENLALQFSGIASKIDGPRPDVSAMHRARRGKPIPEEGKDILERDESWYMLKPSIIDLIYEPLFGFEKKKLEL